MENIESDPRFKHVPKDPRFKQMPRKERKVVIDKRFQVMFSDKRFKLKYSVDKRGRPVDTSTNENLKKYYELSSEDSCDIDDSDKDDSASDDIMDNIKNKHEGDVDDESLESEHLDDSSDVKTASKPKQIGKNKNYCSEQDGKVSNKVKSLIENEDSNSDANSLQRKTVKREKKKMKKKKKDLTRAPDMARGAVVMESSSEDEELYDNLDDEFDHGWGELDKDVPEAKELGHRLAICNMDWDRIKAQDLFLLISSFVQPGGILYSIKIYASEYGQQRMAEEEQSGPVELTKQDEKLVTDDETPDGSCYNREKLRQYQLNRLKYYYAVADFDSVKTASYVYDECDGREFESSSSKLDLRYIPDDMEFDEKPKSECTSIAAANYKPQNFFTTALCQSKVDLTWDETDHDRVSVTMKKFQKEEINEDDFKAFLASDAEGEADYRELMGVSDVSGLEDTDEEKQIDNYKQLLKEIDSNKQSSKNKDLDMEITWEPGLKETTKDIVKKKGKEGKQTPWEEYLQKKKEKKKKLRMQKKSATEKRKIERDAHAVEYEAFSDDDVPDDVDLKDSYFAQQLKMSGSGKKKTRNKKKRVKLTEEEMSKQKEEQEELSLLTMEENEAGKQHFNLKDLIQDKKKKKKKKNTETTEVNDDFKIKVDDPRFGAVYNSHLFNIDPSAPEFKRTKGIEAIIEEKLKRRKFSDGKSLAAKRRKLLSGQDNVSVSATDSEKGELPSKDVSLTTLVKSVKAKTRQFYGKNKVT